MSDDNLAVFGALPGILGAFETLHETILFDRSGAIDASLPDYVSPTLTQMEEALDTPRDDAIDAALREALEHLRNAERALAKDNPNPSLAFLSHRRDYCQALRHLYLLRGRLPGLASFWFLPGVVDDREALELPAADAEVPVGIIDWANETKHGPATLYIPESYSPSRRWPVIVALHGAYGRGSEYLFTWLRPAKSHRCIVIAPSSSDVTWSILDPRRDGDALLALLDAVSERYAIDSERVLLTGLSDGGTFTYLTGLAHADRFAGIAPIAGAFHEMMDPLLRQKQGQALPTLIVHGAKDPIFPVRSIRSAYELMSHLGYAVTYEELPNWGHAYPYSIHERLVMPWFQGLRRER